MSVRSERWYVLDDDYVHLARLRVVSVLHRASMAKPPLGTNML